MASSEEIRLRIVEALARTASVQAMADTPTFLQRVAEIETFVIGSQHKSEVRPPPVEMRPTRKGKSDPDFMA